MEMQLVEKCHMKVKVTVSLPSELWEEFQSTASELNHRKKVGYSAALDAAIRLFLAYPAVLQREFVLKKDEASYWAGIHDEWQQRLGPFADREDDQVDMTTESSVQ